jgi:hypothetical protein
MTAPYDHEAFVRRALHAAADSLDPHGDGLDRIRARARERAARPRAVAWLAAVWDQLWLRVPAAVQDVVYRVGAVLWETWDRIAPPPAPGKHRSRTQGVLRPLAAMAAVVFMVAAGTYVAIDVATGVSPSSTNLHPQPGSGGHPAGSPAPSPSHTSSGAGSGVRRPSPSPTDSCVPDASPDPSGSASCEPSVSPQPSPSASTSPSPSATPTPTPTDSSPTDSPSPAPS